MVYCVTTIQYWYVRAHELFENPNKYKGSQVSRSYEYYWIVTSKFINNIHISTIECVLSSMPAAVPIPI